MRILLVGPLPEPVNGCSYANQVFQRVAGEAGHCIRVANTSTPDIGGRQGDVFSLRKALTFLAVFRFLPLVIWSEVVYLTPGQTFFGLLKYAPFMNLARLLRRPYVIHVHGNHLGRQFSQLEGWRRRVFRYYVGAAERGIVLSISLRENFKGLLPDERVHVVENFAGDELYGQDPNHKPRDKLRIVFLGNLMREKGIFELLRSLLFLRRLGVDFHARIAGSFETGVEHEARQLFDRLSPSVQYIGRVSGQAKVDLLRESNTFVLPTYYTMEGQPIALLEGMAAGNIIVTTRHAGIPDILDASNGFLLRTRDCDALTQCLLHIANNLAMELERVSRRNIDVAAERFTERAFSNGVLKVLNIALGRQSAQP